MVIADGEAAVATTAVTAWPHVGQNAVAFEISLPHFEQYTKSPFRPNGQAGRRLRESYFPPVALVNLFIPQLAQPRKTLP
jgi:hypothetical protein